MMEVSIIQKEILIQKRIATVFNFLHTKTDEKYIKKVYNTVSFLYQVILLIRIRT